MLTAAVAAVAHTADDERNCGVERNAALVKRRVRKRDMIAIISQQWM